MLDLTNTSGRLQVFVLAHETYCASRGSCACALEADGRTRRDRLVARSLTIASGTSATGVEDAVLAVADVARAVRRGELAVARRPVESAVAPEGSSVAPPEAHATNRMKKRRGAG